MLIGLGEPLGVRVPSSSDLPLRSWEMPGANGVGARAGAATKERHLADREAETRGRNEVIRRRLADLDDILTAGVAHSVVLDHNARKLPLPVFDAGGLDQA